MLKLILRTSFSTARRSWYRLFVIVTVVLTMAIPAAILPPANAQTPSADRAKIGAGVIEALRTDKKAHIVIALTEPPMLKSQPNNLTVIRQEVAALQDAALSGIAPAEFTLKHKYQAIPALSGILLTEAGLRRLAAQPAIVRIDLDAGGTGSLAQSVPFIGATTWHASGVRGNGVVVAVLDSGLDTDHSDFAGAVIHQACFADNDGTINGVGRCPNGSDRQSGAGAAEDDAGHGTHVTGIIGSRGQRSAVGVAPKAQIVAVKVTYGPSSAGSFQFFSEIVAALDFIINSRPDVDIINMSLGTGVTFAGDCDGTTSWNMAGATAINMLRNRGTITFASAGNNSSSSIMTSPACLSNVISVGATTLNDTIASFSNTNAATDIVAPGVTILSSFLGNGTISASGTSMASPHAAGCAALLMEAGVAITPDQIETWMEDSPIQVTDARNGLTFPRLDCRHYPLSAVVISGPTAGIPGISYGFTATVSPLNATLPLTYTWQADGQAPIVRTGGLTDTAVFEWEDAGTYTITITAANRTSTVSATHTIQLQALDRAIYLPMIVR